MPGISTPSSDTEEEVYVYVSTYVPLHEGGDRTFSQKREDTNMYCNTQINHYENYTKRYTQKYYK